MDEYYTVKELSQLVKISDITIRQWIHDGKLKSVKIGGARRIPKSEVERLIKGE